MGEVSVLQELHFLLYKLYEEGLKDFFGCLFNSFTTTNARCFLLSCSVFRRLGSLPFKNNHIPLSQLLKSILDLKNKETDTRLELTKRFYIIFMCNISLFISVCLCLGNKVNDQE